MDDRSLSMGPFYKGLLYQFSKRFMFEVFRLFGRLKVVGHERIKREGPLIIAANHRSFADPPLVGSVLPREVHFLAKKELFSFRPFGWLITQLNAHPLNRMGDISAFKTAQRILKDGFALIVFPEGKRIKKDQLGTPKMGVAMLAFKADCPVLPVYLHNSARVLKFRKLIVAFGHPVQPKKFDSYESLTHEIMKQIQRMKDCVERGRLDLI